MKFRVSSAAAGDQPYRHTTARRASRTGGRRDRHPRQGRWPHPSRRGRAPSGARDPLSRYSHIPRPGHGAGRLSARTRHRRDRRASRHGRGHHNHRPAAAPWRPCLRAARRWSTVLPGGGEIWRQRRTSSHRRTAYSSSSPTAVANFQIIAPAPSVYPVQQPAPVPAANIPSISKTFHKEINGVYQKDVAPVKPSHHGPLPATQNTVYRHVGENFGGNGPLGYESPPAPASVIAGHPVKVRKPYASYPGVAVRVANFNSPELGYLVPGSQGSSPPVQPASTHHQRPHEFAHNNGHVHHGQGKYGENSTHTRSQWTIENDSGWCRNVQFFLSIMLPWAIYYSVFVWWNGFFHTRKKIIQGFCQRFFEENIFRMQKTIHVEC